MIISTQTAYELGWKLPPVHIVRATGGCSPGGYTKDYRERIAYSKAVKAMEKAYPTITHVLNAKLVFAFDGHPSNGYTACTITGDGYFIEEPEVLQPAVVDTRSLRPLQF